MCRCNTVPKPMSFNDNIANNWKVWFQRFKIYILANLEETAKPRVKTAMLFNFIEEEGVIFVNTYLFDNDDEQEN